jgi:hypothetical protein
MYPERVVVPIVLLLNNYLLDFDLYKHKVQGLLSQRPEI